MQRIHSFHLDVLKEIGNIGAAHAATALSGLLHQKIDMRVPNVRIVSFDEMMELAGGPDNVVATVFLRIEGDITGSMFFTLSLSAATYFIHQMIGDEKFTFDSPQPYSRTSDVLFAGTRKYFIRFLFIGSVRFYEFKYISICPIFND